jgi:hypothetical protein
MTRRLAEPLPGRECELRVRIADIDQQIFGRPFPAHH